LLAAANIGLVALSEESFGLVRDCSVPERFYGLEPQLTKTAKVFASGREVTIVVLGGASTVGVAAGSGELA
jgi:hypothetical protein